MTAAAVRRPVQVPGLRRVSWVSVSVDGDEVRCTAHGIGHRLPRRCPVTLTTALALREDGVPLVVHPPAAS